MDDVDELIDQVVRAYTVFGIDPIADADEFGIGQWLERLHPRGKGGMFREVLGRLLGKDREPRAALRNESAKDLMGKLKKGGFTYHLPTGNYPDHGNSVAIPGHGREFDNIDDLKQEDIDQYVEDTWDELTKDPSRHLGGWLEGNKVFLDVAEVLDDAPEEAVDRARSRGEIASFDLATFETTYVPYFKDRPPPPGSAAARALALPEGHKDKIQWAGDITPKKRRT